MPRHRLQLCAVLVIAFAVLYPSVTFAAPAEPRVVWRGDLPRTADHGFEFSRQGAELVVSDLVAGSAAQRAGLRDDDRIVAIAGWAPAGQRLDSALRGARGGQPLVLQVARADGIAEVRYTPPARPTESLDGLHTTYDVLDLPGGVRLRTLFTRPEGATGRLPAIFFVQWVSCDSVELTGKGAWLDVIRGVAMRSGMAMYRIERSASGDSIGPECDQLDLDTELAQYRAGLDRLLAHPGVDPSRVFVMGNSIGSTLLPLVVQHRPVAGVIVNGGGALTWFERMLAFDRQRLERAKPDPATLDAEMRRRVRFHTAYLLDRKSPEQIEREQPALRGVWSRVLGGGGATHYGRPYAFHQQLAAQDLLAAWAGFKGRALVVFNGFDQYETRHGHELVVQTLNRLRPGSAEFVELPMTAHSFTRHPTLEDAYAGRNGVAAPEPAIEAMVGWLTQVDR